MSETLKEKLERLHTERESLDAQIAACYKESLAASESDKACEDWIARVGSEPSPKLRFPIEVSGITNGDKDPICKGIRKQFSLVKVRPCDKDLSRKTFLGIYIGDVARGAYARFHRDGGVLELGLGWHNPAIWVPDLERFVFGCESWWVPIEDASELKQITDEDIGNIWYVKLLAGEKKATEAEQ